MAFRLCAAGLEDADDLLAVEGEVFPEDSFSRRQFRDLLRSPRARVVLARTGRAPAGFVVVWWRRGASTCRIINIAVRPRFRRRGLARCLVAAALGIGRRHGFAGVTLEVEDANRAARALYRACGFRDHRRLPHYYEEGRHAWRMVFWISAGRATGRPRAATGR